MKERTDISNKLFAGPTSGRRTSGGVEALPSGPRCWPLVGHLPCLTFSILKARGNFAEAVRRMLRDYKCKTLYLRVLWKTVIISVDPRRHGTCFAIARGHEARYRVPNC